MIQYAEIAVQRVSSRGIIIPATDIFGYINKQDELYMSMYRYDEEILEHFKIRKTISNYRGKHYLNTVLFDIDKGEASDEDLLIYTRHFIEDLDLPEEYIQPWYSGTGYHIVIPNLFGLEGSDDLPAIMSATMKAHFPDVDQLDMPSRLVRVGYTRNPKSNLYKTPFSIDELESMSFEEVKHLASTPRYDFGHKPFADGIEPIWADKVVRAKGLKFSMRGNQASGITPQAIPNGTAEKEMNGVVTCVQKMYNEGPVPGSRHLNMIRMISSYRRHGIPREAVHSIMQNWLDGEEGMTEYEVKIQVDQIYDKGYRFGCADSVLAKYCDTRCIFYTNKNMTVESRNATEMEKSFSKYAKQDFSKTAINLRDYYTMNNDWMIYPKEFVIVTGLTGLGKTAWVQNLVTMTNGMKVLFFSLELHESLIYRRFIQMAHKMAKHEVQDYYKEGNMGLSEAIQHIEITTVVPELSALERTVAETNPQVVVVDTTDEIEIAGASSFDKDVKIALGLKHIAEKHNLIVIGIHHTNKAALSKGGKVTLAGLGGTSKIPQKADKVIAINGNANSLFRTLDTLKQRDESPLSIQFELQRKSFWYEEVKHEPVNPG